MTHFAPVEPDTATGETADLFREVKKSLGAVPNMAKVMVNSPTLVRSWLALAGATSAGTIDPAVRERLAIATAQLNGCEYCLSAHTYLGANVAKLDADELDAARHGRSADPRVTALLALSQSIAENAGDVDEAEIKAAIEAGVTEEEIGELVANLALNVMTNYFNVLARTENEWPVVSIS
ncbi:carboxymuconolactone decarboxylase family protein [Mycobacterium sp. NPDC003449]